jgi:hypothetical protein
MTPITNCLPIVGNGAHGMTPLYQTVGEAIEKLLKHINPGEKVVMTIFTDGEENSSRGIYANGKELKALIKNVEDNHNFTISYMGTKKDIETVIRELNVDRSNTLEHMNTAYSVGQTYAARGASMVMYSKAVSDGASQEELRKNFFTKKISEDQE